VEAGVAVRARRGTDINACVELFRLTYDHDGYPAELPEDLHSFVRSRDAIGAWVAIRTGEVVGHVGLHRSSSRPVMDLAVEKTGLPASSFGVVARLVVTPTDRGTGIGRHLLITAASDARTRGLRPLLDVSTAYTGAINLYERSRWTRLGTVHVTFDDGFHLDEFVYLAPES
jgi:[ribosomal protein S18]-alanine N-acetyltransferase